MLYEANTTVISALYGRYVFTPPIQRVYDVPSGSFSPDVIGRDDAFDGCRVVKSNGVRQGVDLLHGPFENSLLDKTNRCEPSVGPPHSERMFSTTGAPRDRGKKFGCSSRQVAWLPR